MLKEEQYPRASGELAPEGLLQFYEQLEFRPMNVRKRLVLSDEGQNLQLSKSHLRTWEHSEIRHANLDRDDRFIIECALKLHEERGPTHNWGSHWAYGAIYWRSGENKLTLQYNEYGDKNASLMLFLHGGGVSDWMWDKQTQYFTHFHCIVPILPEHGLNNNEMNFSIKGSAEVLIKLIEEKAKGKKIILIGFSLGAQVIVQILSMKPDLIDFAIINSALVRPIPYIKKLIKPTIKLSFPLIKNRYFSKLQAKTLYVNEEYYDKYFEESSQMKPDTLIRVLQENMSFEIPEDFKKAKTKILVTVGEKEKAVMKKSAKDILAANANSIGVILPKIGHGFPLAMPTFFNHMVEVWLDEGHLPKEWQVIS